MKKKLLMTCMLMGCAIQNGSVQLMNSGSSTPAPTSRLVSIPTTSSVLRLPLNNLPNIRNITPFVPTGMISSNPALSGLDMTPESSSGIDGKRSPSVLSNILGQVNRFDQFISTYNRPVRSPSIQNTQINNRYVSTANNVRNNQRKDHCSENCSFIRTHGSGSFDELSINRF